MGAQGRSGEWRPSLPHALATSARGVRGRGQPSAGIVPCMLLPSLPAAAELCSRLAPPPAWLCAPASMCSPFRIAAAQLLGLALASWIVLTLPLDIANTKTDGGLRIDLIWQFLYTTISVCGCPLCPSASVALRSRTLQADTRCGNLACVRRSPPQIWCICVIPFAIFYYESEDPEGNKSAMFSALKWTCVSTVVAIVVTFMMWGFLYALPAIAGRSHRRWLRAETRGCAPLCRLPAAPRAALPPD